MQEKLKNETKDRIFNLQLEQAISKKKEQKLADAEKTYAETVDHSQYTNERTELKTEFRFKVEGDDKFFSKKWEAMMKDCTFYFDSPSLAQELQMKRTLQKKYADDLFKTAMKPRLQTRKDLVLWACES